MLLVIAHDKKGPRPRPRHGKPLCHLNTPFAGADGKIESVPEERKFAIPVIATVRKCQHTSPVGLSAC